MKKTLLVFGAILLFGLAGFAQDAEYPKFELSGMASAFMADIDQLGNETMWGWGIGGQYNANKYFGIVAEYNANHGSSTIPDSITESGDIPVDLRVQTILFGPRVSYRAKMATVFGHFLLGAATLKMNDEDNLIADFNDQMNWQIAYAIGGGLDINLGKHFAIRPIQLDYVFTDSDLIQKTGLGPGAFNNIRYNFGAVFKF
jgi:hypothetical protein